MPKRELRKQKIIQAMEQKKLMTKLTSENNPEYLPKNVDNKVINTLLRFEGLRNKHNARKEDMVLDVDSIQVKNPSYINPETGKGYTRGPRFNMEQEWSSKMAAENKKWATDPIYISARKQIENKDIDLNTISDFALAALEGDSKASSFLKEKIGFIPTLTETLSLIDLQEKLRRDNNGK